jgi:hypothetical protein
MLPAVKEILKLFRSARAAGAADLFFWARSIPGFPPFEILEEVDVYGGRRG